MKLLSIILLFFILTGGPGSCDYKPAKPEKPCPTPLLITTDQEELNKRTTLLNEICPTRQKIKQCKEWCKQVDCKE